MGVVVNVEVSGILSPEQTNACFSSTSDECAKIVTVLWDIDRDAVFRSYSLPGERIKLHSPPLSPSRHHVSRDNKAFETVASVKTCRYRWGVENAYDVMIISDPAGPLLSQ